jgi:hypothetical protein
MMKSETIGKRLLVHSEGGSWKRINAQFKYNELKVTCNMPHQWIMVLTRAQALRLADRIKEYYGDE